MPERHADRASATQQPHWAAVMAIEFAVTLLSVAAISFLFSRFDSRFRGGPPASDPSKNARAAQKRLTSSSGPINTRRAKAVFNNYEDIVAGDMVFPDDIDASFDQIGGVDEQKTEIFNLVCLPLQHPELFHGRKSNLLQPPSGVLLYGPPGTGKTMLAKAIAKESGAAFINLKMSTAMNMWFGESQKIVHATFSLARKLAPSIIFIDEIDAFLKERRSNDDSANANMKAEFMALWDGINSENASETGGYGVIVIGATNRPYDVDPAILRRMPRAFKIGMPDARQREDILRLTLRHEDVAPALLDRLSAIAQELEGYSGSDIKELCRAALTRPFRAMVAERASTMRPLTVKDFREAMESVRPTGESAQQYREEMHTRTAAGSGIEGGSDNAHFLAGVQYGMAMAQMAAHAAGAGNGGAAHNHHFTDAD